MYEVVEKDVVENQFNVFFSESVLHSMIKPGVKIAFLYSEKYIIPITLNKHSIFWYAHLCTEPAVYKNGDESLKQFLDDVIDYLRDVLKVQWVNQNSASSFFLDFPSNTKHIPFGSHVIDLSLSEEELWKNVHSKHRNVIKKAEKDGVVVVSGVSDKLIEDYHAIDVDTWKRSNRDATGIEALKREVRSLADNAIIYIAYMDGEPQSGAFLYYNKQMCYYIYGANKNNPHIGSGNLLQWRAILDMKAKGVKKYSFVGCRINEDENSKYHGIQRFKERFGGKVIQGFLFKKDFNPIMRKLFNVAVSLRGLKSSFKYIPYKDIIDQEIHKWPQE